MSRCLSTITESANIFASHQTDLRLKLDNAFLTLNDLVYDDNDHDTNDTNNIGTDNERKNDDEINLDLEEATCNLPDPETWKYRPDE